MASIFVSYRHCDCEKDSDRLYADLKRRLPWVKIFRDARTIPPGEDFLKAIQEEVDRCSALIVLIGLNWQPKRLSEPGDVVQLEIESGLAHSTLVIPVLVDGASHVKEAELPKSLKRFARLQVQKLSVDHWDQEVGQLVERLASVHGIHRRGRVRLLASLLATAVACIAIYKLEVFRQRRPNAEGPRNSTRTVGMAPASNAGRGFESGGAPNTSASGAAGAAHSYPVSSAPHNPRPQLHCKVELITKYINLQPDETTLNRICRCIDGVSEALKGVEDTLTVELALTIGEAANYENGTLHLSKDSKALTLDKPCATSVWNNIGVDKASWTNAPSEIRIQVKWSRR